MGPGLSLLLALMALDLPPAAAGPSPTELAVTATDPAEDPESSRRHRSGGVLENLKEDGKYLLTFPKRRTRKGLVITAAVLGGVGVLVLVDDEIRTEAQEARNDTLDRWESRIEPLGKAQTTAVAAIAVYAVGRLSDRQGLTETGRSLLESLFFTELFKSVGKGLTGRLPPGPDARAGDFFSGGTIFPSGHTARAFAFATVLAERYGRRVAWIAYPVATLVGLFRVVSDDHWASDVLAGAALGWAVGKAVVRLRGLRAAERRRPRIVPMISPDLGAGIAVRFSL